MVQFLKNAPSIVRLGEQAIQETFPPLNGTSSPNPPAAPSRSQAVGNHRTSNDGKLPPRSSAPQAASGTANLPIIEKFPFDKPRGAKTPAALLKDQKWGTEQGSSLDDIESSYTKIGPTGSKIVDKYAYSQALERWDPAALFQAVVRMPGSQPNQTVGDAVLHNPVVCEPICDKVVTDDMPLEHKKAVLKAVGEVLKTLDPDLPRTPTVVQVQDTGDNSHAGVALHSLVALRKDLAVDTSLLITSQLLIEMQRSLDAPLPVRQAMALELAQMCTAPSPYEVDTPVADHFILSLTQKMSGGDFVGDEEFAAGMSNVAFAMFNKSAHAREVVMSGITAVLGDLSSKSDEEILAKMKDLPGVKVLAKGDKPGDPEHFAFYDPQHQGVATGTPSSLPTSTVDGPAATSTPAGTGGLLPKTEVGIAGVLVGTALLTTLGLAWWNKKKRKIQDAERNDLLELVVLPTSGSGAPAVANPPIIATPPAPPAPDFSSYGGLPMEVAQLVLHGLDDASLIQAAFSSPPLFVAVNGDPALRASVAGRFNPLTYATKSLADLRDYVDRVTEDSRLVSGLVKGTVAVFTSGSADFENQKLAARVVGILLGSGRLDEAQMHDLANAVAHAPRDPSPHVADDYLTDLMGTALEALSHSKKSGEEARYRVLLQHLGRPLTLQSRMEELGGAAPEPYSGPHNLPRLQDAARRNWIEPFDLTHLPDSAQGALFAWTRLSNLSTQFSTEGMRRVVASIREPALLDALVKKTAAGLKSRWTQQLLNALLAGILMGSGKLNPEQMEELAKAIDKPVFDPRVSYMKKSEYRSNLMGNALEGLSHSTLRDDRACYQALLSKLDRMPSAREKPSVLVKGTHRLTEGRYDLAYLVNSGAPFDLTNLPEDIMEGLRERVVT